MLEDLLPGPLSPLLPPGSIHLHDEILMEDSEKHKRMKGKARMSTGKLEMLMCDGHYDAIAIVQLSLVNAIGKSFGVYKKATLVQQFNDSYLEDRKRQFDTLVLKMHVPAYTLCCLQSPVNNQFNAIRTKAYLFGHQFREEMETMLPTLIEIKFEAKEEEIVTLWTRNTNYISKKVILFPQNLNDMH